jgi:hypothetical protein
MVLVEVPAPYASFIFRRVRRIEQSHHWFRPFRLAVHMEQLSSHWKDFRKNLYLNIFRKSVEKIQLPLKSDKNNKQSQDGTAFHPDSDWKRSSKTCMKLASDECTLENS